MVRKRLRRDFQNHGSGEVGEVDAVGMDIVSINKRGDR